MGNSTGWDSLTRHRRVRQGEGRDFLSKQFRQFCVGQVTGGGRRATNGRSTPTGPQENQTILPMRTVPTSPASSGTTRSATMRTTSSMVFMLCVRYRNKQMFVFHKLPLFLVQWSKMRSYLYNLILLSVSPRDVFYFV